MKSQTQSEGSSKPIVIDETLSEKCDGPNQFENFDKLFRSVIGVPKTAIDAEEAKYKRARAKRKRATKP